MIIEAHPVLTLKQGGLRPCDCQLALAIRVPSARITAIVSGMWPLDTTARLGCILGDGARF